MIGMTVIAIYLGIGIIIGLFGQKYIEKDLIYYENRMNELNESRNEAETFEEKSMIRDSIVSFDNKNQDTQIFRDLEKVMKRETFYKMMLPIVAIGWLPLVIKVAKDNFRTSTDITFRKDK